MGIPGFPFGTVTDRRPGAPVAPAALRAVPGAQGTPSPAEVDIATFALAYQMMRDAKALPTTKFAIDSNVVINVPGAAKLIAQNAQRKTPIWVRVRASLTSIAPPFLYLGTDQTQVQGGQTLDRISNGGQSDFLLYPGQDLWASYAGDAAATGEVFVSVATFDEAVTLVKRATGQAG